MKREFEKLKKTELLDATKLRSFINSKIFKILKESNRELLRDLTNYKRDLCEKHKIQNPYHYINFEDYLTRNINFSQYKLINICNLDFLNEYYKYLQNF